MFDMELPEGQGLSVYKKTWRYLERVRQRCSISKACASIFVDDVDSRCKTYESHVGIISASEP